MKYTLATRADLATIIHRLNKKDILVWDCETTGLHPYAGSEIFSLAVCDGEECVYFNFKDYGNNFSPQYILEKSWLAPLFNTLRTWVAHNAKFDMHFTDRAGILPFGKIIDTEVLARVFQNHYQYKGGYSLDACAKRWLGQEKDDRVMEYMKEHKFYHSVFDHETGKEYKNYQFDWVPFPLISEYAMKDAEITWNLYKYLNQNMYQETEGAPNTACETEAALTQVLFNMEKQGVAVDIDYAQEAFDFEKKCYTLLKEELESNLNQPFIDSAKTLVPYFESKGFTCPKTEKGNDQITDEVLSGFKDPVADMLLKYREHSKRANTYFHNYLVQSDEHDYIHPNFRQAGTVTGRMSCNNPNLQNIPTSDDSEYPIRRCFIPSPDFIFVSIDYAQMEFRLMLDYANQEDLIEKIKAGFDPHDATAELTGLDRKTAKTLNFGIIYRMGLAKLGKALGISEADAGDFRRRYFSSMPKVKRFIYEAPKRQEDRGFTYSWAGRRFYLDDGVNEDGTSKWSYKAANSIIQGGCADICKRAMVDIPNFLGKHKSRMVLQVHDEILFEVHRDEIHVVQVLREIMEKAYPAKHLPLTCSVAYSTKSFHDMIEVEGVNAAAEIRKALSSQGFEGPKNP